jgi:hypothetical protein
MIPSDKKGQLMKNFLQLIIVLVMLISLLLSVTGCNDNEPSEGRPASSMEFRLEKYGTWDYSHFLDTVVTDFYYDPDSGMSEAITINIAEIGGTSYLVLTLDPTVGPGENSGLFIFDIENPVSPRLVSSIVHPAEERKSYLVRDIAIQDGIVYAGLFGDKGLWVVDISDPASPKQIVTYWFPVITCFRPVSYITGLLFAIFPTPAMWRK